MGQISSFSFTTAKESDGRSTETVTESARSTDSAPAQFSEGHDHSQQPGAVSVGSLGEQHTITPDDGSATVPERKASLQKRDSVSSTAYREPPETEATLPPHTDRPETTEAPMYLGRPNSALMPKPGRRDSLDSQLTTQSDSVLPPKQPPGFGSSTPRFKGMYKSPGGLQGFTARGNDTGSSIQMPYTRPRHAPAGKAGSLTGSTALRQTLEPREDQKLKITTGHSREGFLPPHDSRNQQSTDSRYSDVSIGSRELITLPPLKVVTRLKYLCVKARWKQGTQKHHLLPLKCHQKQRNRHILLSLSNTITNTLKHSMMAVRLPPMLK